MIIKEGNLRKVFRIVTGLGTFGVFSYHAPSHIFPQWYQTEVGHRAEDGHKILKPGKKYWRLLDEVCIKMNLESNDIDLFFSQRYDSCSAGLLFLPQNPVIGLPQCCKFATLEELRKTPILYREKEVNWNSPIGKAMLETYQLSDEHVKFLIACELMNIKKLYPVITALHATMFWVAVGGSASMAVSAMNEDAILARIFKKLWGGRFNSSWQTFRQGIIMKLFVYISVLVLGMLGYIFNQQSLHHWMVYETDKDVANLGPEYVSAGIECLRKGLKYNRIIRKMTADGDLYITEKGDEIGGKICYPFKTDRLKRLKAIQKSSEIQKNDTTEN